MRIFISYRRGDTAGRAGRLFDVFVSRFGIRNVFQDVAAIAPGTDFPQEVTAAIAKSDAMLVVIGPEWLTIGGAEGTPRLHDADDYLRAEIGAALAADLPVVPVLVGDARLPSAGELPEELRPLATRQAARVRDDSWHQDVDALVRRLEGETVVASPRRRWPWLAGAAAAVIAIVVVGMLLTRAGGDGGGGGGNAAPDPPPCGRPDDSWQPIEITTNNSAAGSDHVPRSFVFTVEAAGYRGDVPSATIVVQLRLENISGPTTAEGSDDFAFYIGASDIDGLYVDGVSMGPPTCFSASPRSLEPGDSSTLLIGFDGTYEPDSSLVLATSVADIDVTVAGG